MQVVVSNECRELIYSPQIVKFTSDNFEYESEHVRIVCEGVIYNSEEICGDRLLSELLEEVFLNEGIERIPNLLHGSYVIAIFDKKNDEIYIVNDLLSKKPLYYYVEQDICCVDTSFFRIVNTLKKQGIKLTISKNGLNEILEGGVFTGDNTYCEEVHFLQYAECIHVNLGNSANILKYEYHYCNTVNDDKLQYLYELFDKACKQAVQKNQNAGYRCMFTLSGGMDSRCTFETSVPYVSHIPECFSYGHLGCNDLAIAAKIANDAHCDYYEHIINPMYILKRERIVTVNEAQMDYIGTTGLRDTIEALNLDKIGIVFTGLGGGEIMGDICSKNADNFFVRMQDIRTCLNFAYTIRDKVEVFSPYLDEDYFMTMLQYSYEELRYRKLYFQWYRRYFKCDYPITNVEGRIRRFKSSIIFRYAFLMKLKVRSILGVKSKWAMNPLDTWFCENKKLREYTNSTIESDLSYLREKQPNIVEGIEAVVKKASTAQKMYVLTATAALVRMF